LDILFIHQNMPGQFRHLAAAMARDPGNRVLFIGKRRDLAIPGVRPIVYPDPRTAAPETHAYLRLAENCVRHGQSVARIAIKLKSEGFNPAIVIAHPGWGEALFVRDIWPATKILTYAEFFYRGTGADLGFDPDEPADVDAICRARVRNTHLLLSLEAADAAISPTHWQKSVHPVAFQPRIHVIFDGIDVDRVRPDPAATAALPDGTILAPGDEVLTYVARNLEPYRGFPSAMRALPRILEARPNARAVFVGGDEVSYGRSAPGGVTWRAKLVAEVGLERFAGRVHFTGKLPYATYLAILQRSSAHLYLTYPFVLSWSCLEAMAAGCLVVASATAPVLEVIEDGHNGLLVPFSDPEAIARRVIEALALGRAGAPLRAAARATVLDRYRLADCLEQQQVLVRRLLEGRG
jgi:glycosyltransferase involved in cell wall biosynthesis